MIEAFLTWAQTNGTLAVLLVLGFGVLYIKVDRVHSFAKSHQVYCNPKSHKVKGA